ncbi:MAG: hypothetical protein JW723_02940 [Bacteroidales bacterium]|nr:hypothetical protein [Bacteroidales bacterium]
MKEIQFCLFIAMMVILISGCSESDNDDDNGVNPSTGFNETCNEVSKSGLIISIDGDVSSEIDPGSVEFNNYLACVQNCAQTNPNDPQCMMDCLSSSGLTPAGGAYALRIEMNNATGADTTYAITFGTWFKPASNAYQPVVMAVPTIWEFIPDSESVTRKIPVFCLVSDKAAPGIASTYTICATISQEGCMKDILTILETKDMTGLSMEQTTKVQRIIWDCTGGNPVDLEYLNGLPSD